MGGKGSGGAGRKNAPRALDPTRDPWARQPDETAKAFEAFAAYRDLGPSRSVTRTAEALGKNSRQLEEWCSRWVWVIRSHAWDDHLDAVGRAAEVKELKEMKARHVKLGQAMQAAGGTFVAKLVKQLQEKKTTEINPGQARLLIDSGTRLERLTMGEAGDKVEIVGDGAKVAPTVFILPSNGRELGALADPTSVPEEESPKDDGGE